MPYLTEQQLRSSSTIYRKSFSESDIVVNEMDAEKTIFLSHSHKDRDLVLGFIDFLAEFHIRLYVDWQDSDMPEVTNRVTAEKIKKKIRELDYFLVLATTSALASRWVPWEIGVADMMKAPNEIAIIPVVDSSGQFRGNEYLQLYQRITIAESGKLGVFPPNVTDGVLLKSWLS